MALVLSADQSLDADIILPERRIVLNRDRNSITIGRASKVSAKGFVAAPENAWFHSAVMSRLHAQVVARLDEKVCFCVLQLPASLANSCVESGNQGPWVASPHFSEWRRQPCSSEGIPGTERRGHATNGHPDLAGNRAVCPHHAQSWHSLFRPVRPSPVNWLGGD